MNEVLPSELADAQGAPIGLRRAERQARARRRRRFRLVVAGVVVLVAAAAAGLTALHPTRTHHAAVAGPPAGERTLLLGIGDAGAAAQSVALYGVDPATRDGGTLLIPPDTLVDGPGGTVGGSYPIVPTAEFAGSVSDLLGVKVSATWRLTPAGLAALVDQLGGVTVDVDTTISTPTLTLNPGSQLLHGQQAAAYALDGSDTEQARANRTRLVFDAILAKLPAQPALTALLGSLGANSVTTQTSAQLATFLTELAKSNDGDNEDVLPTTTLDTGGTTPSFAFDEKQAPPIVRTLFPGALLRGNGAAGTRVEVVNDSGEPNLATGARARLTAHDLTFVRAVNDQPFHQYAHSSILVFDDSVASIALGHKVAAALGIPNAPVLVSAQTSSVADALAVLSDDYPG